MLRRRETLDDHYFILSGSDVVKRDGPNHRKISIVAFVNARKKTHESSRPLRVWPHASISAAKRNPRVLTRNSEKPNSSITAS